MKQSLFSKTIFAMLLAFTLSSFVYFGFANIYSSKILNHANFLAQFQTGIYQYRILSSYFLLGIYDFLTSLNLDYDLFKFKFLKTEAEPQMYLSFYILNTVFLVLSALILVLITAGKNFLATESEKILLMAVAIFTMVISQFVIVPYDISSYFFLLLFFYALMQYLEESSTKKLLLLIIIMAISTLNRETGALSLALAGTFLYSKHGIKRKAILPILSLTAAFLLVYGGLRFSSENFTSNDGNLFLQNFTEPKNILGFLFWIVMFWLSMILAKDKTARKNILLFHLFSLPYLLICFYTGILYEIRLYVPIFITSLLISQTSISKIH